MLHINRRIRFTNIIANRLTYLKGHRSNWPSEYEKDISKSEWFVYWVG
ncbi:MAG: hypothetical protein ACTS47_00090 [Candidatus Hodgkinia cicadicola]